jgi:hypothetical protein
MCRTPLRWAKKIPLKAAEKDDGTPYIIPNIKRFVRGNVSGN